MRKHLLLLLTTLCLAGEMSAQEVIIGTGTSSDYDIAFYPYYMDSYWESLYQPSEIGMPGLITSVALQTGAGPGLQCNDVRIYIGTRNTTFYSSTTDWTPSSSLTLVYSGANITLGGSNGWENYTLQTPFMYDGSSTLVIVFAKHATDYSVDASYYYHSTDNYSSLYKYMDEDPTYAQYSASSTGSRAYYRPNTKLTLTPDSSYCGAVGNIQVTGITTDAATISWNTPFNPHSYIVEVKTAAQNWNDPNVMTYTTNDTFQTVTGLTASTVYTVRVANDCVTDTSNYTTAVFNTQCGPMSALPLVENFDLYTHTDNDLSGANNLPNCWDYLNTGSSSPAAPYVYYSTSTANSGSYSVRFYTGSGSGYSDQYAFLPTLDIQTVTIQNLSLGLNIRRQGNSGTFRLVVGVTDGMDLSTFTVIDTLTSTSGTYAYHEVPLSGYSGSGNRIVLKAPKPASGNNRGHVDDIVLGSDLCATPSNLSVTNADEGSVTLQWVENGTATVWEVEYGPAGFATGSGSVVTASSNPFTITGLTPATTYEFQVRADCGGSVSNWSLTRAEGTTTCVPLTTIPFSENFDSYTHTSNPNNGTGTTNVPICWDTYNSGSSYPAYPYVYYSTSNSYSGNYSLRFYTSTGSNYADEYAILPAFDSSIPLNTLQVSMKARSNSATLPFTLVVGQMSGGPSTFEAIDTLVITGTDYAAYVAYLDTYTGTGNRIALKAPKLSSNNRGYVDDIMVNYLSDCRLVSNVTVSNITTTGASVSWQPNGDETSWFVDYRAAGDSVWQTVTATSIPYQLTNLTNATQYYVRVAANCVTEIGEYSADVAFTTVTCDTADQCLYTFNLEDSFGDGWNNASLKVLQGGIQVTSMTVSSNAATNATFQVALCDNVPAVLTWTSGSYDSECSFEVVDPFGEIIYTTSSPSAGTITTLTINCTPPSCPRPSSVSVSNIGDVSATVSWVSTGTESAWNIEYRPVGTTTWLSDVATTNPHILTGLTASTNYELRVQADCGGDVSDWRETTFQTAGCALADQCSFTFYLEDSFGDGWNGATLNIQQNGITVATLSLDDDYAITYTLNLCDNAAITLSWNSGSFDDECSFEVRDPFNEVLYSSISPYSGTLTSFVAHCTPPTCPRPASVTVSGIGTTSATVSWVSTGTETAWNIEYKPTSSSTWTSEYATTNPYTLTGLTATTMYDLRVQADCGGGDVSDWRETTFNTSLCEVSEQCVYTLYVTGIYDDSWDYSSLVVQQNGITVTTIANVSYSATVPVSLCNGVSTSLVYNGGYFDDECSVTFTAPDGTTLFNQSDMSYYSTYTFTPDCGFAPEPCETPTGLAVNSVTQSTAVATWTAGGTETSWNVQYKAASASSWQNATANTTTYTMSGLTASTAYQVRVQANCGDTQSEWTTAVSFTTEGGGSGSCATPTGLTASNIESESITVNWDAASGVSSWNVQYRPEGGQLSTASTTTNSYTITGLTGNTTYQIQVQANCGDGHLSDWTQAINVTTTGIDSWLASSVTLYPNPAKEYVDIRVDGDLNVTAMEVYDVYGKLVNTVIVNENPTRINLSGIADGMYFVRVTTEAGMVTKRFVKQ